MDLCFTKEHLNTFVIVSGDSDFSPLVSKLRENNKTVIGLGIKHTSSHLLQDNCDEFIFYDDLEKLVPEPPQLNNVPPDKVKIFRFLTSTLQALMRENRELIFSSMIKQTMKRKIPSFDEGNYGYTSFSAFLEDAKKYGLIEIEKSERASGTYVVTGFGTNEPTTKKVPARRPTKMPVKRTTTRRPPIKK
jgi:hypothetical protein